MLRRTSRPCVSEAAFTFLWTRPTRSNHSLCTALRSSEGTCSTPREAEVVAGLHGQSSLVFFAFSSTGSQLEPTVDQLSTQYIQLAPSTQPSGRSALRAAHASLCIQS
ncbi:hypothetical protein OH77DRAFT_754489 [Trametes cingulata]|nr:hypothetical protein OH77DRAFT_754489 [Trametes cingulata]